MKIHRFPNGSYILADHIELGRDVRLGPGSSIRAGECVLGDDVSIGAGNTVLVAQRFEIGAQTRLGDHNSLTARSITLGEYVFWDSHVTVGHGGKFSPDAHLRVGAYSMICARVTLNVNHAIRIGEYVGIGEDVAVWTHGSFLPILDGFPADFGPVSIGHHVWLPAKSTVLPNRRIGNHVVIGTNSLINKDLPDGCLAAGIPVRILKENQYPRPDPARNEQLVRQVLADYAALAAYKNLAVTLAYDAPAGRVRCNGVVFDLNTLKTEGEWSAVEEDFRDYLRRRGIKFFTGQAFRSIVPDEFQRLLAASPDDPDLFHQA